MIGGERSSRSSLFPNKSFRVRLLGVRGNANFDLTFVEFEDDAWDWMDKLDRERHREGSRVKSGVLVFGAVQGSVATELGVAELEAPGRRSSLCGGL